MSKYLGILLFLCMALTTQAQQAWTQQQGKAYVQLGGSLHAYDHLFLEGNSTRALPRQITQMVALLYTEYGITDRLTANVVLPFQAINSSADLTPNYTNTDVPTTSDALYALGNIEVGLTYNFVKKNNGWVVSGKLNNTFNTSSRNLEAGLQTGFDAYKISPSLLVGLGKKQYFTSAEVGYSFLGNGYSHRYFINGQIGKKFTKKQNLIGILAFNINAPTTQQTAAQNSAIDQLAQHTGLYLNESAYYASTFKIGYEFQPDWTAWLTLGGGIGLGVNVGQNFVYSLAVGYQL